MRGVVGVSRGVNGELAIHTIGVGGVSRQVKGALRRIGSRPKRLWDGFKGDAAGLDGETATGGAGCRVNETASDQNGDHTTWE